MSEPEPEDPTIQEVIGWIYKNRPDIDPMRVVFELERGAETIEEAVRKIEGESHDA